MNNFLYWKLQTKADESANFNLFREKYGRIYNDYGLLEGYKKDEELRDIFDKIAYKNPLFSKIYSLTIAYTINNSIRVKYLIGEEKDLIQSFLNVINNPFFNSHTVVSYDAGVLLPYFGIRAEKNGVSVNSEQLKYKGLKSWNIKSLSLRDYFKGAGDYNFTLQELADVYGLDCNYIDYYYENDFLISGQYGALMESAKNEVVLMINCHRKSNGEDPIFDVEFKDERVDEVKPEGEFDPLKELVINKEFTPQIKKAIQDACKGKRLTKQDKENLKEIILGGWLRTDFINKDQDSKARIQEKTAEVEQFMTTL